MPGSYALPAGWLLRLGAGLLRGRRRSFRADALACVAGLQPPLQIEGREHIPPGGPCLLTVNHYTRPGLRAWWVALAASAALSPQVDLPANAALSISAALPTEVHWLITSAWTYRYPLRRATVTPLSAQTGLPPVSAL